jgi:hypothetical protein
MGVFVFVAMGVFVFVRGGRASVSRAAKSNVLLFVWEMKLHISRPFYQVAVAVAHRLAWLVWIFFSRQEHCQTIPNT